MGWAGIKANEYCLTIYFETIDIPMQFIYDERKGVFPRELKVANVIPLFKAGNIMFVNNYTPVCILPVFSMTFEKLMFNRLS